MYKIATSEIIALGTLLNTLWGPEREGNLKAREYMSLYGSCLAVQ